MYLEINHATKQIYVFHIYIFKSYLTYSMLLGKYDRFCISLDTICVSLDTMYLFHVNVSIKTIDKNSNKEFVKQACLSFYVYCNVIGMEGTLACPLVQYLLLCL